MENNLLGAKLQLNKVNVMRGVDKYSDELGKEVDKKYNRRLSVMKTMKM